LTSVNWPSFKYILRCISQQAHISESEFRYNGRKNPDMFGAAIGLC
jgi:hypothetical protein